MDQLVYDGSATAGRAYLSYHERLCLVRALTGFPHPVVFLITYPSASLLPSFDALSWRLGRLQSLWPHMYTRLGGIDTNAPYWTPGPRAWTGQEVIRDAAIPVGTDAGELLHADMKDFMGTQLVPDGTRPMIRVTRYTSKDIGTASRTRGNHEPVLEGSEEGASYLAIAINHLVADGLGSSRIVRAIFADEHEVAHLRADVGAGHPPRMEHTIDLSPPAMPLNPLTPLADPNIRMSREAVIWPGMAVSGPTTDYPQGLSLLQLPADLVRRLKVRGKDEGVDKLHSILKAAWAVAMCQVLGQLGTNGEQGKVDGAWDWAISTPRNERRDDLHPHATGDYVSRIISRFSGAKLAAIGADLNGTLSSVSLGMVGQCRTGPIPSPTIFASTSTASFWSLARTISAQLSDPTEQQAGRHAMSLPSILPNSPNEPGQRTAWEEHYLAQARLPAPLAVSAILSNLTRIPLPPNATGMSWAQPACPFSAAIMVSIVGNEAGVSWTSTWREGCAVRVSEVKAVERAFVEMLCRVS